MKKALIFKISFILLIILVLGTAFFVFENKNPALPNDNSSERCEQKDLPYLDSNLSTQDRVNDLMGRMTDWEKIGQMILIEKNSIHDINDITRYNLGALLSGGGAGPKQDTPLAWLQMINNFQSAAQKTCLKIPLLYGIDAIHGAGNVIGATIFPHFIGLGATRDPDLVRRVAEATAEEIAATGIYWNYAPNLDVAKDIRWGKTYETFGSDTENVAQLGLAYLEGTQNSSNGYLKVLANPKHFIGGGSMEYGTSRNKYFKIEEGNINIDEETLRQVHLVPFKEAVDGGARAIMVGTATWRGKMNSSNHYLLTDVLKKELGFSGFIVSDWYGVYEVAPSKYESLVLAINAGVDMVMSPFEYKDFMSNMQKALFRGDITKERIDDAVRRILTVKFETGLFDRPQAEPEGLSVIGSDEHRDLAREAVRKSQVLLKNTNSALPLSVSLDKIIVAGAAANNLGRQAGGWTTEWQGIDGNYGISGTTILEAIKNAVSKNTEVQFNEKGNFSVGNNLADVGIVVVGEKPYAEGWGDNPNPKLSPEDLSAIEKTKAKSKKIIVVIISGRPLDISSYSENWDGIVASWLPGSEGEGITDVLFGLYPFTGTLPVSWNISSN
ncbi:MAG: glycoside hydrolase family 3 N-terminal domain-containing protein [Candidatus Pacebacteria bacterium]|nr:glycoside hydrolase family 3 N-terminal domain-containing protein [Candidatus Paceibacterota bacterium]